ncbi:MAG: hypothetical protein L0312_23120 [Acidobacteria bacterium]|nr:hypothetical protein [Acidobacteriota bacterium]
MDRETAAKINRLIAVSTEDGLVAVSTPEEPPIEEPPPKDPPPAEPPRVVPSEYVIRDVFIRLDPVEFSAALE